MNFTEEEAFSIGNFSGPEFGADHFENDSIIILNSKALRIVMGVFAALLSIAGVAGNFITLLAIYKNDKLRKNKASWFIASLSASDLLFSGLILPIHAGWLFQIFRFSDFPLTFCRLKAYVSSSSAITSMLCLLLITFNRYIAIVHNDWYCALESPIIVSAQITIIWLFAWGPTLLPYFEIVASYHYYPSADACILSRGSGTKTPTRWIFLSSAFLCITLMVYFYTKIFQRVRESRKAVESFAEKKQPQNPENPKKRQCDASPTEIKLAKTMMMTLIIWVISYVPVAIVILYGFQRTPQLLLAIANVLFASSTTTNFIVYALYNPQYREAYKSLLCGNKPEIRSRPSGSGGTQSTDA